MYLTWLELFLWGAWHLLTFLLCIKRKLCRRQVSPDNNMNTETSDVQRTLKYKATYNFKLTLLEIFSFVSSSFIPLLPFLYPFHTFITFSPIFFKDPSDHTVPNRCATYKNIWKLLRRVNDISYIHSQIRHLRNNKPLPTLYGDTVSSPWL
jgi:hypothetical protein